MGKNLKGKEYGKGISQRKDGLYCARYADKYDVFIPSGMTVYDWFNYWIKNIFGELAPNMRRKYLQLQARLTAHYLPQICKLPEEEGSDAAFSRLRARARILPFCSDRILIRTAHCL